MRRLTSNDSGKRSNSSEHSESKPWQKRKKTTFSSGVTFQQQINFDAEQKRRQDLLNRSWSKTDLEHDRFCADPWFEAELEMKQIFFFATDRIKADPELERPHQGKSGVEYDLERIGNVTPLAGVWPGDNDFNPITKTIQDPDFELDANVSADNSSKSSNESDSTNNNTTTSTTTNNNNNNNNNDNNNNNKNKNNNNKNNNKNNNNNNNINNNNNNNNNEKGNNYNDNKKGGYKYDLKIKTPANRQLRDCHKKTLEKLSKQSAVADKIDHYLQHNSSIDVAGIAEFEELPFDIDTATTCFTESVTAPLLVLVTALLTRLNANNWGPVYDAISMFIVNVSPHFNYSRCTAM